MEIQGKLMTQKTAPEHMSRGERMIDLPEPQWVGSRIQSPRSRESDIGKVECKVDVG